MNPSILSSDKQTLYRLKPSLLGDFLQFRNEGSAALLWIAMHLTDERPWMAARNPMCLDTDPGFIDSATKRILGKRFQKTAPSVASPLDLDPYAIVLNRLNHNFRDEEIIWPVLDKQPGKLLPRRLTAHAKIISNGAEINLYARNFSEISQCLHAELTLLLYLSNCHIKVDGFDLHTTLKPCRMCAAFLHSVKDKTQSFKVRYDENDPGPLAANTLLDQFGYEFTQ